MHVYCGRTASTAWWITGASSMRCVRSSILPRVMRLRSSRSSTSLDIWATCRSSISEADFTAALSRPPNRRTREALLIGASGLRSSWASIARNSFFRRSASDRSSASLRRLSSARFRSLTSRTILDAPTTLPASSLIGEIVRETWMRLPSARTRSVSKCSIRSPAFRLAMIRVFLRDSFGGNDQRDVASDRRVRRCGRRAVRRRRSTSG